MNGSMVLRLAVAAAAVLGGTMVAPMGALAAEPGVADGPTVTVTPATDLIDGQRVALAAAGFGAGTSVGALQCAEVEATVVACNHDDAARLVSDESGSASGSLVTRRAFDGVVEDSTSGSRVAVDCGVSDSCFVMVVDDAANKVAITPISFRVTG